MSSPRWFSQMTIAALAFALCGGPQLLQAQIAQPSPDTTQQQQDATNPAPATSDQADPEPTTRLISAQEDQQPAQQQDQNVGTTPRSATPNPSKGPLQPAETNEQENTPEAPQPAQQQPTAEQQQPEQAPAGAAAAGGIKTAGGAASRPAGTAIAPAKQHQTRSLLIKMGAVAAGAVALGTVYALSRSSPSTPGTHASATGTSGH
jgi:hypothetical protein